MTHWSRPAGAVGRDVHGLARRGLRRRATGQHGGRRRRRRGGAVRRAGRRPARCRTGHRHEPACRPASHRPRLRRDGHHRRTWRRRRRAGDGGHQRDRRGRRPRVCRNRGLCLQALRSARPGGMVGWVGVPHVTDLPQSTCSGRTSGSAVDPRRSAPTYRTCSNGSGTGPSNPARSSISPSRWTRSPKVTRRWMNGERSSRCSVPDEPNGQLSGLAQRAV